MKAPAAAPYFRRFVELYPSHPLAQTARQRLGENSPGLPPMSTENYQP